MSWTQIFSHLDVIYDYLVSTMRGFTSWAFSTGYLENKKSHYKLTYFEDDQNYIIMFPKHRGPAKIVSIIDPSSGSHIYNEMIPYLGPGRDFHSIATTPRMLGYEKLKIVYRTGRVTTYEKNEIIRID